MRLALIIGFLAMNIAGAPQLSPQAGPAQTRQPVTGAQGMVSSAHPLATEAGMQILREGGNAFDAAVAVAGALAVVEPTSSGLGGGAFFLIHREADQLQTMIDAREVAPIAATRDMFLDKDGNPVRGLPVARRDMTL